MNIYRHITAKEGIINNTMNKIQSFFLLTYDEYIDYKCYKICGSFCREEEVEK